MPARKPWLCQSRTELLMPSCSLSWSFCVQAETRMGSAVTTASINDLFLGKWLYNTMQSQRPKDKRWLCDNSVTPSLFFFFFFFPLIWDIFSGCLCKHTHSEVLSPAAMGPLLYSACKIQPCWFAGEKLFRFQLYPVGPRTAAQSALQCLWSGDPFCGSVWLQFAFSAFNFLFFVVVSCYGRSSVDVLPILWSWCHTTRDKNVSLYIYIFFLGGGRMLSLSYSFCFIWQQ